MVGAGIGMIVIVGLIALVPLALALAAIISIFTGSRPMEQKLLWTVLVVLAPFLGAILYFIFGRRAVQV